MHVFKLLPKRDANAAAYLQRIEQVHMEGQQMAINFVNPGSVGTEKPEADDS